MAPPPVAAPPPATAPPTPPKELPDEWLYEDPQGNLQGPFPKNDILEWFDQHYFEPTLKIRNHHEPADAGFQNLGDMLKLWRQVPPPGFAGTPEHGRTAEAALPQELPVSEPEPVRTLAPQVDAPASYLPAEPARAERTQQDAPASMGFYGSDHPVGPHGGRDEGSGPAYGQWGPPGDGHVAFQQAAQVLDRPGFAGDMFQGQQQAQMQLPLPPLGQFPPAGAHYAGDANFHLPYGEQRPPAHYDPHMVPMEGPPAYKTGSFAFHPTGHQLHDTPTPQFPARPDAGVQQHAQMPLPQPGFPGLPSAFPGHSTYTGHSPAQQHERPPATYHPDAYYAPQRPVQAPFFDAPRPSDAQQSPWQPPAADLGAGPRPADPVVALGGLARLPSGTLPPIGVGFQQQAPFQAAARPAPFAPPEQRPQVHSLRTWLPEVCARSTRRVLAPGANTIYGRLTRLITHDSGKGFGKDLARRTYICMGPALRSL
jgi:hypothetical protein